MRANPNLVEWLDRKQIDGRGKRALKVGCGLGDDAKELAGRGFEIVAFDISRSAIAKAKRRFPDSPVDYQAADLFRAGGWRGRFDLVLESYTLQVLPAELRREAMAKIASFLASYGVRLVVTRARYEADDPGQMPWPLTRREIDCFRELGLSEVAFEDYLDQEKPPVRRFRAEYHKGSRE